MDLEDLQTFVEVADCGGISPAARRLGIPKSIVSRRLARLEQALGAQLLARNTQGAALTEAGAAFRERAVRIVAELEAAREVTSPNGEARGLLRITAPASFGPLHLGPVFAELARRHPALRVHTTYTDRFVDPVSEGFDAAVRMGFLPDSSLLARRIRPLFGKYVASPAYVASHGAPQTPDELLSHEALMQGTETWRFLHQGQMIVLRPQGRFKADTGEALLAAALAGLGIAALPDLMIDPHIASGALTPVLINYPPPEAGLFVVRPPSDFIPRKVRLLTDILIEHFG